MPEPTRRQILTGAACLAAKTALPLPATAFGVTDGQLPFTPSSLLLEHRRRAPVVLALKAVDPLTELYALDVAGLLPVNMTSDEVEALAAPLEAPHRAAIQAQLPALAAVSRAIWATPASSWADIVARAELVAFWRHPLSDEDYHGYDDPRADKKLVEAVMAVAVEDRGHWPSGTPLPAFEPPPLLLEHRRADDEWSRRYAAGEGERTANFVRRCLTERALLEASTPGRSWSDVVVRAELSSYRRRTGTPAQFDHDDLGRHQPHRSYAELINAA
jgi:hypothetical protein